MQIKKRLNISAKTDRTLQRGFSATAELLVTAAMTMTWNL